MNAGPAAETRAVDGAGQPAASSVKLRAREIARTYATGRQRVEALRDVSLTVRSGEFVALVGPSGCGKSTLLDVLSGLQRPDAGRVELDGREITGTVGLIGYMPQKDLLMPWRTVLDNTILGLELAGVRRSEARERALESFPRFGLAGFERVYPASLSGGMRQRAALLRTFLVPREVQLLDEPFGALDAITRAEMQAWLLDVRQGFDSTVVLVTHDVDEAIYLADRVYVLSPRPGRIRDEVPVDIPRPRVYAEVVTSEPFRALKARLLDALLGGEGSA